MLDDDFANEVSTVLHARVDATPLPEGAFRLQVVEGPDTGASFLVDPSLPPRTLLGQSPACELRLTDPSVSRRHAALELVGSRLRIRDLGSTNGIVIGGLRVMDAYLAGGELVILGASTLMVERVDVRSQYELSDATSFGSLVGASTEMRRLYPLFEKLAQSDIPVIIEGETGTGKEVLAESIHQKGKRSDGPYVIFDCTAVPPSLVESELFGHERGAFTGAIGARPGVFEQADGGTLFLDEIGDLDFGLQPKLLRALERSEVRRVGGNRWTKVDVRIIAATRRDLDHEVQSGRFRDDLFHRLAVGRVELPPLRSRRGDVQLLASFFASQLDATQTPSSGVLRKWSDYDWPGNVRELRNAVARWAALGELEAPPTGAVASDETLDFLDQLLSEGLLYSEARRRVLDEFEKRYVRHMIERHGGSVSQAARASGLARRYFQRLKARGGS